MVVFVSTVAQPQPSVCVGCQRTAQTQFILAWGFVRPETYENMPSLNRLIATMLAAGLAGGLMDPVPLKARTRKGDQYFAEAARHQEKKEWDAALEGYEKALAEDPSDVAYRLATDKAREE